MIINLPIELDDDFTFGNCNECPLSYSDWNSGNNHCVFGASYRDCPLMYGADAQCEAVNADKEYRLGYTCPNCGCIVDKDCGTHCPQCGKILAKIKR